jgi:hypothetical protein
MHQPFCKQLRSWLGEITVLLVVPALAIASFAPQAWSSLLVSHGPATQVATAAPVAGAAHEDVLSQFSDTQTSTITNPITINLVQQARTTSAALNNAVFALRAQIVQAVGNQSAINSPSFAVQLLLQSLELTARERNAWDHTWRRIGVPGSNPTAVQNQLIILQPAFLNANAVLISFQAMEIVHGQISTFNLTSSLF